MQPLCLHSNELDSMQMLQTASLRLVLSSLHTITLACALHFGRKPIPSKSPSEALDPRLQMAELPALVDLDLQA